MSLSVNELNNLETYIQEISEGNLDSLEKLYRATSTSIYGFALSMLKNKSDAEDATHDCFINVMRSSKSYHNHGKPLAWMLKITRNICLDKIRKDNKYSTSELEEWMAIDNNTTNDQKELLKLCFNALSDEEREIVTLHSLTGMKFKEIADVLDKPISTILSKYNRALKKLKNEITKGGLYES